MANIEFRGKIENIHFIDGTLAYKRIKVPKLERRHCDMAAFRTHQKYKAFANSDLFPSVLARIKSDRLGEYVRLDRIPEGAIVDTNGFLARVTLDV